MWIDAVRKMMEQRPASDHFGSRRPVGYVLALALTGIALLLRLWIAPQDAGIPFITFFPAVALSAILGGLWPGVLSAVLCTVLATYFFLPPFEDANFGVWSIAVFLGDGVLVSTAIEAMHRYYRDYILAVHDLEQSRAEAEEARQTAELANRTKTDFLANMSHELRTPLNAIIGFSDTMLAETFGPLAPKYAEYASDIHQSGQHLLALINDLLDMSAIEAGKLVLTEETFNLKQAITPCLRMIQSRAEQGGVAIVDAVPNLPPVIADQRRITQIVLNLMSNAVKFTPVHGAVTISAQTEPTGGITITVADTGIGMNADGVARAMLPFAQINNRLQRAQEGTGLGLPVSRSLAQLHGGDLSIDSLPGKGTIVCLYIPAKRVVTHEPRAAKNAPPATAAALVGAPA
jgi:signal transduction histidine kinase